MDLPVSHRREERFVLIKNSALIEQFLIFVGAKKAAFLFMNAKIEHQIKGDANRIANCEANNIGKSVEKASRLLSLLAALKERGLLSSLPQELEETAKVRLLYPDLSISQLCLQLATPITKSGMNHRLTKLTQAAEELVVKYGLEY
jgi:DNA-binding protein WhiA